MKLPFFFVANLSEKEIVLDEDTSKHIIGVLRKQKDEELLLTDGKGIRATAVIKDDNRKRCAVQIIDQIKEDDQTPKILIGISLIKNASRFEWFLEKATEIGVSEIIPLICSRTEKEKFKHERFQSILISAMLQSQQCWLPVLHEPTAFEQVVDHPAENKFIAHCEEGQKQQLNQQLITHHSSLILIGPEGDFTPKEIDAALAAGFKPVSLGNTRLRTETAGMVAAVLLCQK